jgi:hypothetical protein
MHARESDLTTLASTRDIIAIGMRADEIRRARHGAATTFVRVAAVAAEPGATIARPPAAGELRIAGAPQSRASAVERVRAVAAAAGGAAVTGYSLADLLEELRYAGLELVAEAPIDRLQNARRSIEEVNIAGLSLARLTVEQSPGPDPMPLLTRVHDLQREVAVLRAFAPLPRRINPAAPTTGYEDVRHVALARIVVDNVPSIQVDWSLYGPKLAQVALTVGADDVDAVSAEEGGAEGPRRAPLEEIRRNIRAAGLEPVERNGRFERISTPAAAGVGRTP